jgi:ArsR family transcriptional regulator, virulence genes transcriptional regulator
MDLTSKALAEKQADICSIFAHPTRILILWTLAKGEKSVGEIAATVETSLQNTSQHLRLMKKMGILRSRREAQTIYYRVVKSESAERCQLILNAYQNADKKVQSGQL